LKTLLQINVTANLGSTGRIAEGIGIVAQQNGWQSYIAYGRACLQGQSELIKIGNKRDILLHGLRSKLLDQHGLGSVNATIRFIENIKKIKPDLIHLHNIHGYYLNYKVLFNFLSGLEIPLVWTFHDCWPMTGHCAHFDSIGCEKWKKICNHCPLIAKYPGSLIADRSSKNYILKKQSFNSIGKISIVSVSDWLGNIVKQSFLNNHSLQTIYNGIDTEVFDIKTDGQFIRNKYGVGSRFMILSVATAWSRVKGLNDLIELSKYLNDDEVLVLVGLSSKQLKDIPPTIIGIPRTENRQGLASLYSAADLLISTSYEETFGLTIAESLACGTPSIVYNKTASPEVVSGDTGFVVTPKDYNTILEIIKTVQSKGKLAYSDECRTRVLTHFDQKKQYQKYISLYNSLI
jgi:putative colanic acid biosynthesis glycosyltransferase